MLTKTLDFQIKPRQDRAYIVCFHSAILLLQRRRAPATGVDEGPRRGVTQLLIDRIDLGTLVRGGPAWTWPHHCGHMWELRVSHLLSRAIDLKGLTKDLLCTSLRNFLAERIYFQSLMVVRKVWRLRFPNVSCVIWPSPGPRTFSTHGRPWRGAGRRYAGRAEATRAGWGARRPSRHVT